MASTTDKITDVRNAARPNSARVSTSRSAGGANLACNDLTGWPTASKVHFVTYQIDSNSNPVSGTQLDCSGIVSGATITNLAVIDGTDTGNSVGDVVEMLPTAAWGQDLADGLTVGHDRTGAHKTGATYPSPNITGTVSGSATYTTPTLTTPTISDFSSATHTHANTAGGGLLNGANAITDGTITPAELTSGTGSSWAWQSFTPSWTNLTPSNGTNSGSYIQIGKTVFVQTKFVLGSSSSIGTAPYFNFPVAPNTTNLTSLVSILGKASLWDTSGSGWQEAACLYRVGNTLLIRVNNAASTYLGYSEITSLVPWTWATGDELHTNFVYEAA